MGLQMSCNCLDVAPAAMEFHKDDIPCEDRVWSHIDVLSEFYLKASKHASEMQVADVVTEDEQFRLLQDIEQSPADLPVSKSRFFEAVRLRDHTTMRTYIQQGSDSNVRDMHGWTAINYAVLNSDFEALNFLVEEAGCDINTIDLIRTCPWDYCLGRNARLVKEFMNRKVDQYGEDKDIFLHHFEQSVAHHSEKVGMAFFYVISRKAFLEGGEFLHFDRCQEQKMLSSAEEIKPQDKVLFISHRWGAVDHPDPDGTQFALAKQFLEKGDVAVDWVWLDYSCINQDKDSEEFWQHLKNIPTAIVSSTYCLVIPKTEKLKALSNAPYTDIQDYLDRGWCKYEAVGALITGSVTYVAVHLAVPQGGPVLTEFVELDTHKPFKDLDLDEEGWQGFKFAATEALSRNVADPEERAALWRGALKAVWFDGLVEPSSVIARAIVCVKGILADSKDTLRSIIECDGDMNQIMHRHRALEVVGKAMGNFTSEADRGPVACFLLSMVAMCMHRDVYEGEHQHAFYVPDSYEDKVIVPGRRLSVDVTDINRENMGIYKFLSAPGAKFFRTQFQCFNWVNFNHFTTSGFTFGVFSDGSMAGWVPWADTTVSDEFNGVYSYYYGRVNDLGQFFIKGVYTTDVEDNEYGQLILSEDAQGRRVLHAGDALYHFAESGERHACGRSFFDMTEIDPVSTNEIARGGTPSGTGRSTPLRVNVFTGRVVKVKKVRSRRPETQTCRAAQSLESVSFDLAVENGVSIFFKAVWQQSNKNLTSSGSGNEEELVESFGEGKITGDTFELRVFYQDGASEFWHGVIEQQEEDGSQQCKFSEVRYALAPWQEFQTTMLGYDQKGDRVRSVVGKNLTGMWRNKGALEFGSVDISLITAASQGDLHQQR